MQHDKLIIKPIVTEKTTILENGGKYIFKVHPKANKIEVAKALEKIFNTKVESVNILNTADKAKKRGKTVGMVFGYKKAIVTLKKGQKIKIREEAPKGSPRDKQEKEEKKAAKKEKVEKKKNTNK